MGLATLANRLIPSLIYDFLIVGHALRRASLRYPLQPNWMHAIDEEPDVPPLPIALWSIGISAIPDILATGSIAILPDKLLDQAIQAIHHLFLKFVQRPILGIIVNLSSLKIGRKKIQFSRQLFNGFNFSFSFALTSQLVYGTKTTTQIQRCYFRYIHWYKRCIQTWNIQCWHQCVSSFSSFKLKNCGFFRTHRNSNRWWICPRIESHRIEWFWWSPLKNRQQCQTHYSIVGHLFCQTGLPSNRRRSHPTCRQSQILTQLSNADAW